MSDERSEVADLKTMNVTLSESELQDFALTKPNEPADQPQDDKKSEEADKGPDKDQEGDKGDEDKTKTPDGDPGEKGKEGEKDQDDKDAEAETKKEAEKKAADDDEEDDDPVLFESDDKKYTQSDLQDLIKGGMQEADYTQKSQELGSMRSSIEPLIEFINKIKGEDSKEIAQDIRAALVEDKGEEYGKLFDAALNFDPEKSPHPDAQKAKDLQAEVDKYKAKAAFADSQKTFVSTMKAKGIKISRKEAEEVGQFTLKYFRETGAAVNMEDAYKLMKAEDWRTKADEVTAEAEKKDAEEKDRKSHEAIPDKTKGASNFSKEDKPLTPSSSMKVSMEEAKEAGISTFFDP